MNKTDRVLPVSPSDYFDESEWTNLTKSLEPAAKTLSKMAKSAKIRVSFDTRWPCIRLSKRYGLRLKVANLQLQHNYFENKYIAWELRLYEISSFWMIYYKSPSNYSVINVSNEQLENNYFIQSAVLEKVSKYVLDAKVPMQKK